MFGRLFRKKGADEAHRPTQSGFVFRAFISYRSVDKRHAAWLHRQLEHYRIPSKLAETGDRAQRALPTRLGRFFRDRADAAGSHDLAAELNAALKTSETLVVVCSPRAAESTSWVSREIETFRSLRPDGRILAVIAYGKPPECFPAALLAPDGSGGIREPLAADMRWQGDGRRRSVVKLVAGLLQVDFDALWQREKRRALAQGLAIVLGVAVGAGAAAGAGMIILNQTSASDYAYVDQQIFRAREAYARGDDAGALRAALLALPANLASPDVPYKQEAEIVLSNVLMNRALVFSCTLSGTNTEDVTTAALAGLIEACQQDVPEKIKASAHLSGGPPPLKPNDAPVCDNPVRAAAVAKFVTTPDSMRPVVEYWIVDPEFCQWRATRWSGSRGSSTRGITREWESGWVSDEGVVTVTRSVRFRGDPSMSCIDRGRVCYITGERNSLLSYGRNHLQDIEDALQIELRNGEGPANAALSGDGQFLMGIRSGGVFEVWDVGVLIKRPSLIKEAQQMMIPSVAVDFSFIDDAQAEASKIKQASTDPQPLRKSCRQIPQDAQIAAIDSDETWWAAGVPDPASADPAQEDHVSNLLLRMGRCDRPAEISLSTFTDTFSVIAFPSTDDLLIAISEGEQSAIWAGSGLAYYFENPSTNPAQDAYRLPNGQIVIDWLTGRASYNLPRACQQAVDEAEKIYSTLARDAPLKRDDRPLSFLLHKPDPVRCVG